MKNIKSVKDLCEFIWELEDKYNLIDFEINGVKPWQAHRIEIYYELGKQIGIFENELQRGMKKIDKLKAMANLLKNSLLHNPLHNLHQVDFLLFSHPRSKIVDGKPIDIYTNYFVEENSENNFFEFEEHFDGKHEREYKSYKRYLDYINLKRNINTHFINISLDDKQKNVIKNVQQEINNLNKNMNYDIASVLIQRTKKFLVTYKMYKEILQKTTPKEIYVVVSYGRAELIKAAKDLGIKIVEFQHGTFSKYHLGYSYPNKKELDYFPDEFWVWNEYWQNLIEFPISKKSVKIYPFQYLEKLRNQYDTNKKFNQLVVLGQGGLTDRMAKKMLDNLDYFKRFNIIFKLHPEEYGRSDLYKNLSKLKIVLKVEIVEDIDLYGLLAQSKYQAGVFSTALYEGVEFRCKTILFNLPGVEYMDRFIEMYEVEVI